MPMLRLVILLVFLCHWLAAPVDCAGEQRSRLQGVHGSRKALPKSCRSCHLGMTMALDGEEKPCLGCHSGYEQREKMVNGGFLDRNSSMKLKDVANDLKKPYAHPVFAVRGIHRDFEELPEQTGTVARHSECVDCHAPHDVDKGKPYKGLDGRRVVNVVAGIEKEYELCYLCHANSANLPGRSTNKWEEFRTTNKSFHPVEGEGRSAVVVSLKEPYVARKTKPTDVSIISCSDCHGSDDPNGPRGPHGSSYAGLLSRNYEMEDGRLESEFTYALCYRCHDRNSILANESFPYHSLHIQGNRGKRQPGTSCFTCHDAHGSSSNPSLIRFNDEVVRVATDGKLEYKSKGVAARHGSCSLNCHGVEHKEKEY